jgi:glycosyltransferase involved in cell wall biosynthesis
MKFKPKLLIFIVAYNASTTISQVLKRIPSSILHKSFNFEVLIIDDSSTDDTFEKSILEIANFDFKITVLFNPVNLGYGGNQKVGYHYAIVNNYDYVALVHGDGQYAPEVLPELMEPFSNEKVDAVFGSRMLLKGGALKGGMPIYKYFGNKILTSFQNLVLNSNLSEFHSGYRIYSVEALKSIRFELNTNDFHFDTEIIIQLFLAKKNILELPIPTYYGDEICRVNGLRYALDVAFACLRSKLQHYGFLYDDKFIPEKLTNLHYKLKLGYDSTHTYAISSIKPNSTVLDIACAGGYIGVELKKKGCIVTGIDIFDLEEYVVLDNFIKADLNNYQIESNGNYDYILMLDIIEHLNYPEDFVKNLKNSLSYNINSKVIITTGNVAFIFQRILLFFGVFNYGERGILDKDHKRLFTFFSIKKLFRQHGFNIISIKGVPAPFPLVLKNKSIANMLLRINLFLIRLFPTVFSFQIFLEVSPIENLNHLLSSAINAANNRNSKTN